MKKSLSTKQLLFILVAVVVISVGYTISRSGSIQEFYAAEVAERTNLELSLLAETTEDFTVGATDPTIRLVIYTDTDCPFCARFEPILDSFLQTYPDKAAITYRHYKLPIYPNSRFEHIALECVGILQGAEGYRNFQNEVLFQNSLEGVDDKKDAVFNLAAEWVGEANHAALQTCIESDTTTDRIDKKVNSGRVLGATMTPTWFVLGPNGEYRMHRGQVDYDRLIEVIGWAVPGFTNS